MVLTSRTKTAMFQDTGNRAGQGKWQKATLQGNGERVIVVSKRGVPPGTFLTVQACQNMTEG